MQDSEFTSQPLPGFTVASDDTATGYTGRKLNEYIWIPKPKIDLYEYRQMLKLCEAVEQRDGHFNDQSAGAYMVEQGAIFDGRLDANAYKEKYAGKTVSMRSYVSNARLTIRICRWLGWMTRVPGQDATFRLTDHGKLLTQFQGTWPARRGRVNEADVMLQAFAEMKFYSVNDVREYQNRRFRQRVFLNMLRILAQYGACSHFELALTAFCLRDERVATEWQTCDDLITELKGGQLTFGEAFQRRNLDATDSSTVNGIFDGPKMLLGFARQFGLVESMKPGSIGLNDQYAAMCQNSGHIQRIGVVHVLTELGRQLVNAETVRNCVWYDELGRGVTPAHRQARAALLLVLQTADHHRLTIQCLEAILRLDEAELRALAVLGVALEIDADTARLASPIVFDRYRDVPPEDRDAVIALMTKSGVNPVTISLQSEHDQYFVQLNLDIVRANRSFAPRTGGGTADLPTIPIQATDGTKLFPIGCIHCDEPPCMVYREREGASRAKDYRAQTVCPDDLISVGADGHVTINPDPCTGCLLCISRCPIGAISYDNGKARKLEYDALADGVVIVPTFLPPAEKRVRTDTQLTDLAHAHDRLTEHDIKQALDAFETQISRPRDEWAQEQFYTWVRNVYRALGLDARYTGGRGMKTRSDVTVYAPIQVTNEIKSPAEGSINAKAVRQAVDSAVQLGFSFTAAVGVTLSNDAPAHAEQWFRTLQVRVPLLTARFLLYLLAKNMVLPQTPEDVKFIFTQKGVVGTTTIHAYFDNYFDYRASALTAIAAGTADNTTLAVLSPMPHALNNVVRRNIATGAPIVPDLEAALNILETLRAVIHAEIDRCFS